MIYHFMSLLVDSFELFTLDWEIDMPSFEMFQSILTIGYSQVVSVCFEHPMYAINHLPHIHQWIFRAHQRISTRLIKHKIIELVSIAHIPHIHDIIRHTFISFLFLTRHHLLYNHCRYIIVWDVMISIFIHVLLNAAIATTDVEN